MKNRAMDRAWFGAYSAAVLTVAIGNGVCRKAALPVFEKQ